MRIDVYRSGAKPAYALVVPAGTDLTGFDGVVAKAILDLQPLEMSETAVLNSLYYGDLLEFLESQIAESGAGLVKVQVQFNEIVP